MSQRRHIVDVYHIATKSEKHVNNHPTPNHNRVCSSRSHSNLLRNRQTHNNHDPQRRKHSLETPQTIHKLR